MDPDLWRRAEALFQAAIEQDPGDRSAFLARACGGDGDLRQFVERLVAAHGSAGTFLEGAATLNVRRLVGSVEGGRG